MFDSETTRFSFFDFLGYILPGALCLLLLDWIKVLWNVRFWGLWDWLDLLAINPPPSESWLMTSLWLVVLSYLVGHIISFMASMTVEVFSHKMYKYPSDFLLMRLQNQNKKEKHNEGKHRVISAPKCINSILIVLIGFVILPISVLSIVVGRWFKFEYYYLKPLDDTFVWTINDRFKALKRKLRLKTGPGERYEVDEFGDKRVRTVHNTDFHRIAYNYEYEVTKQHQRKLDSYIALYGFMRAVCFLSVVLFWFFIIILTKQALWCAGARYFMLVYFFVPYMLFMAFMKFYRRHTLETFMCLMVDEELVAVDLSDSSESDNQPQNDAKDQDAIKEKQAKKLLLGSLFLGVFSRCFGGRKSSSAIDKESE